MRNNLLPVALLLLLVGCATSLPDAIRNAPPGNPSLSMVRDNIAGFTGARIRWGGTIIGVDNRPEETRLEIVAYPLDDYGQPDIASGSDGRFIARVDGFLDPAVYAPGREITVAGVVENLQTRAVGTYRYRFVVVKAQTSKLWAARGTAPYPRYPDSYYDRFYDPFWPWYPWFGPYPFWR